MPSRKKASRFGRLTAALWRRRGVWIALTSVIGLSACVASVVYAIFVARDALRAVALKARAIQIDASDKPDWLAKDVTTAIRQDLAARVEPGNSLTAAEVAAAFERSPWVRGVRVRRLPDRFFADLDFRRPVLAVAWGERCCYVDRDGVALDADTMAAAAGAECLTMEGIEGRGLPMVGSPLEGPNVRAASQLADNIGELRDPLELDKILAEPSSRTRQPQFVLTTRQGARVFWGQSGTDDQRKLERLRTLVASGTKISKGQVLDLR